jgi:pyrimidine deaminase RibD-like protein
VSGKELFRPSGGPEEMISRKRDRELMSLAVELSRHSQPEADGREHPFVGAVIAHPDGTILTTGYLGRYTPGNHAEQEALVGISEDVVAGAVVYSTLEPCTFRGRQTPCCLRLLDRGVSEVVIGILDPNRDIRGRGWWKFEEHNIRVRNFDSEFVQEVRAMNAKFINDQLGPGIVITQVQAEDGSLIEVTGEHRGKQKALLVKGEKRDQRLVVRGTYRTRPQPGHRIRLFVRRDTTYYPQSPIDFTLDRDNLLWESPSAWVKGDAEGMDNEFVVADLSEDLVVATRHYSEVYKALGEKVGNAAWVGISMDPDPPGLKRLASLVVKVLTR